MINLFRAMCLLLILGSLVSCKVKEASVKAEKINNQLMLSANATFKESVGVILPYASVPVFNTSTGEVIGNVLMQNGTQIQLDLNLSKIFEDYTTDDTALPNGLPIPFIFKDGVQIYTFEAGNSIKVYIAVDRDMAVAGVAVPINGLPTHPERDPFRFFWGFNVNQIRGAIGTFHGPEEGDNGFAIFYNISAQLLPFYGNQGQIKSLRQDNINNEIYQKLSNLSPRKRKLKIDPKVKRLNREQRKLIRALKKYMRN